jgi:hypothetical protein
MGGRATRGKVNRALFYTRKEAVCIENVNKKAIATENLKRHARVPLLQLNHFPNPLPVPMRPSAPTVHVAEDGEAVGSLRRFSEWFRLTPAAVVSCLQERAAEDVILDAGRGRRRLLVVNARGLEALCECQADTGDA